MYAALLTSILLGSEFMGQGEGEWSCGANTCKKHEEQEWTFRIGMNFQEKLTCMQTSLWQDLRMSTEQEDKINPIPKESST